MNGSVTTVKTEKFATKGSYKMCLCAIGDDNSYATTVTLVVGVMEMSVTYSQETVNIAADNDPNYFNLCGPVTGEGELKFTGLPIKDFEHFFSVKLNPAGGITIGGDVDAKYRGFSLESECTDGSHDYYCIQKALFKLPALKMKSISKTPELNEFTIPFSCMPYFYTSVDGKEEHATANYFNSEFNSAIWDRLKDTVYDPTKDYTTTA